MGVREFRFFHGITIQSEGIQNIVRTLRAQWRPELVDDLNYYHGIDAEAELTRLMSAQIAEEIDNEIIRTIRGYDNDEIINEITRTESDEEVIRGVERLNNINYGGNIA
jgi:hypothetical protein